MPYVATEDETELYVKEWGPEEGRPVILIHGWPLTADSWDSQSLALAEAGYRVVAYDRRGFGRSSQPWTGYDYDTLADDLNEVIEATGATDATLVGFSMGGGEVARYLSRHGKAQVAQAVLISSVLPFMLKTDDNPDGVDAAVFDGMKADIRADHAAFIQAFAPQFYGNGWIKKAASQGVLDTMFNTAMLAGLWPTLACVDAFSATDFRADMAAFDLPTLILHGTADKTVPIDVSARVAARMIPHAEVIEYDGAAHGVLATNTAEVNRDLLTFLAKA